MAKKVENPEVEVEVKKEEVKAPAPKKVKLYKAVKIQVMDHKKGVCFRIGVPTPYDFPREGWLETHIKAGYLVEC